MHYVVDFLISILARIVANVIWEKLKNNQKGVRDLLASVKELFTPKKK